MSVRLGFAAAAVLIEPDVLFLDEVLAVGDIGFKYKCFAVIERLMRRSAVIFVTHDLGQVQRICSSVMFLAGGRVQYYGGNVAEGLQRYQASLSSGMEPQVAGTGRARITGIGVDAAHGARRNDAGLPVVAYGEDLTVRMRIDLAPGVEACFVVVNVLDQAGGTVAQCNSADQAFYISGDQQPVEVSMRFPGLPLSPGIYRLWVIARHRDRPEPLAVHYGVCPFQVQGDFVGYIAYQPRVEWQAVSAPALERHA
jgi:lipopolysaccharide transport system ATP-binding protein